MTVSFLRPYIPKLISATETRLLILEFVLTAQLLLLWFTLRFKSCLIYLLWIATHKSLSKTLSLHYGILLRNLRPELGPGCSMDHDHLQEGRFLLHNSMKIQNFFHSSIEIIEFICMSTEKERCHCTVPSLAWNIPLWNSTYMQCYCLRSFQLQFRSF